MTLQSVKDKSFFYTFPVTKYKCIWSIHPPWSIYYTGFNSSVIFWEHVSWQVGLSSRPERSTLHLLRWRLNAVTSKTSKTWENSFPLNCILVKSHLKKKLLIFLREDDLPRINISLDCFNRDLRIVSRTQWEDLPKIKLKKKSTRVGVYLERNAKQKQWNGNHSVISLIGFISNYFIFSNHFSVFIHTILRFYLSGPK